MKNILIKKYKEIRPQYQSFSTKLRGLVEELLKTNNISYHLIESRTKEIKSFEEKLQKKQKGYNKLEDMTDISGLRIIVYYPDDIYKITTLIQSEFEVDDKNSEIKGDELNSNEFGYKSFHIVFKIGKNRQDLSEWKQYKDFNCEIQIRTVLQHAWASISHTLQYKSKHDIPKTLQRKLFRLASLFELADEQFSEIKKDHNTLVAQIEKENIETSKRDLNLLSVEQFIKKSKTVNKIYSAALEVGFTDVNDSPSQDSGDEAGTISDLITFCNDYKISSVMDLEGALKSIKLIDLKAFFKRQLLTDRENVSEWYVSPAFILILVLIYAFKDKVDSTYLIKTGWDNHIAERIIKNTL